MAIADDTTPGEIDADYMDIALRLAGRGLGRVWPNPAVGCVLVHGPLVVGRGWTQPGGRPHAETEALGRAGENARGATAYVTLEPCAHHGATGPCADALIGAGIARAVVAVEDPDARVAGRGIARIREAGITVETGVCRDEAAELNAGFFLRVIEGRPAITLKLATSLDGRIAAAGGDSRWITGEAARGEAHILRAHHDAVLIGSNTALADDPELTCRLPGMAAWSPVRVVADRRLRLPMSARLVAGAGTVPTWVLTGGDADPESRRRLEDAGVVVLVTETGEDGRLDPRGMAGALALRGITRLLVEGGGELAAAFLRADLVDRVEWFTAPKLLGADGIPAVATLHLGRVDQSATFVLQHSRTLDQDLYASYQRVR